MLLRGRKTQPFAARAALATAARCAVAALCHSKALAGGDLARCPFSPGELINIGGEHPLLINWG